MHRITRLPQLMAFAFVLAFSTLFITQSAAQSPLFPRPPELEPAIGFWTRVYTEVDTQSGFLHDSVHLDVVYRRLDLDRREIERHRERIREDLRVLGSGKRSGLSEHQKEILALWPDDVSNSTLSAAANNVRWQLGQSDRFVAGLIRSGAYRDHIETVIEEKGLPIELAALPHVESSFHPGAFSSASAAGMWQFGRPTGQRFMRIDHIVDERMDPYIATYAAMNLLEYNHGVLGTWPLALTAYNHGAGGISRAVRDTGTDRIEDIIANYKGRSFGFASRNFYPQFLAVLDVEKQAQTLFGILQLDPEPEYEEVEIDAYVEAHTLADTLGISLEQLRFDNPALRSVVWDGSKRIPRGFPIKVQRKSIDGDLQNLIAALPDEYRFSIQTPDVSYIVQRGDSLSVIARRFNTSIARLSSLNQLESRHRIQIGQRLLLPQDSAAGPASLVASAEAPPRPADGLYSVRRGDTVSLIAQRFGLVEAQLLQVNAISDPHRIYPGQQLRLPPQQNEGSQPDVILASAEPVIRPGTRQAREEAEREALNESSLAANEPLPPAAVLPDNQELETARTRGAGDALAVDPRSGSQERNEEAVNEALSADPSDYSVAANNSIEVQASETLGHYADWLGIRAWDLRRLNNMNFSQPVIIGNRLTLNFDRVSKSEFELKRREYHRAEQEEFFRNYRIRDVDQYQIAANDNIATIARRQYSVPMWLLRQYNPELNFRRVQIGQTIVFPLVEPVNEAASTAG